MEGVVLAIGLDFWAGGCLISGTLTLIMVA